MARPVKKIDGRSREARALRAKSAEAPHKPGPARAWLAKPSRKERVAKLSNAVNADHKGTLKRMARKTTKPAAEVSFDTATSLRILALHMAGNNLGRDTATRDLVPLARQIEEFLTGAAHNVAAVGNGALAGYASMSADALNREVAAQNLHDAEHAFD